MNVAFIPVRGGSKSIPLKNIKLIAGHPLVYWVAKAACECKYIDKVYICTDSKAISDCVDSFAGELDDFAKIEIIGRSPESASDTASTESVMLEFAEKVVFDNICLIQATSPLLEATDLNAGFERFGKDGVDSVISVVRQKRFVWKTDETGAHPVNYDFLHRPRRQEFDGFLVENGAFYITTHKALLDSGCRISGHIEAVEMSEASYFEIDEPTDFLIIEKILDARQDAYKAQGPKDIKMVLTDCDGVLTDGGMYYSENGDESKKFNTKDGFGLAELKRNEYITGIITGEERELNRRRAEKLKVNELISGCSDKVMAIKSLCEKYRIDIKAVAYIGDDLNDLEAIKMVGLGCCPSDAVNEVKQAADFVTKAKGGEGAVRELADHLLKFK